jgi:hypothetical protein
LFACPTLNLVNAWPNKNKYLYLFDVQVPTVYPLFGVPHSLDIPFLLRKDSIIWYLAGGWYFKQARRVSQQFSRAFVDLASKGRVRWPAWEVADVEMETSELVTPQFFAKFSLQDGGSVEEYPSLEHRALPSKDICRFWKEDVGILHWINILSAESSNNHGL